jgi:ParB family chromosome partitioning protein
MSQRLGLQVTIRARGQGGELAIQYSSLDQLDDVIQRLS